MRYGDEMQIVQSGIRLTPKQAAAIGLLNRSAAWGVWTQGDRADTRMSVPNAQGTFDPSAQGPHLVLSPIHPDRWPAVFLIELRMRRVCGTLSTLLKKLKTLNINILSISTAVGGFGLSIVSIIAEHPPTTIRVGKILGELDASVTNATRSRAADPRTHATALFKQRRDAMRSIGLCQIAVAVWLRTQIIASDADLDPISQHDTPDQRKYDEEQKRYRAEQTSLGAVIDVNGQPILPQHFLHRRTKIVGAHPWYLRREDVSIDAVQDCAQTLGLMKRNDDRAEPLVALIRTHAQRLAGSVTDEETLHFLDGDTPDDILRAREFVENENDDGLGAVHEVWRHSAVRPVEITGLISLAHSRVWKTPNREPIPFHYDAAARILRPNTAGEIHDSLCELGGTVRENLLPSCTALSYIHPSERSLRLRFFQSWFSQEIARQIDVEYRWVSIEHDRSPAGILAVICEALHREGAVIHRVENTLIESTPSSEAGHLRLVVVSSTKTRPANHAENQSSISALRDAIGSRLARIAAKVPSKADGTPQKVDKKASRGIEITSIEIVDLSDGVAQRLMLS